MTASAKQGVTVLQPTAGQKRAGYLTLVRFTRVDGVVLEHGLINRGPRACPLFIHALATLLSKIRVCGVVTNVQ
jgi:hypothetical protein